MKNVPGVILRIFLFLVEFEHNDSYTKRIIKKIKNTHYKCSLKKSSSLIFSSDSNISS